MVQAATVLDKMQPEELLLAIALKTPSPDAGYVVRLAREKGLHTVTVADCKALCPAREAELVVLVPMESPFGIPNSTVASVVLNMLWEAVAGSPPQEAAETFVNYQIHLARLQRLRRDIAEYDLPS
jgi:DNA-binding MurR/RpiR family transcriptional regulator